MTALYIKNAYKNVENDIADNKNITNEKEFIVANNIYKTRYISQIDSSKEDYEVEQLERFSLVLANMMGANDLSNNKLIDLGTTRFEELINNKTNIPSNDWIDMVKISIKNNFSRDYLDSASKYIEEGTEKNFVIMKFNELKMVTNNKANHIDHSLNIINSLLNNSNNSFYNTLSKYKHILMPNSEKLENYFNGNNALSLISNKNKNEKIITFSEDVMSVVQNSLDVIANYYINNPIAKKMPKESLNKKIKEIKNMCNDFREMIGENEFSEKIDKMCDKVTINKKKDNILKMNF